MTLTIGQLRKAIIDTPDDAAVVLIYDGTIRHAVGIATTPNGAVTLIRGKGGSRHSQRFDIVEDGLIGWLTDKGMTDESIAELLERSVDSIKRRKKTLRL